MKFKNIFRRLHIRLNSVAIVAAAVFAMSIAPIFNSEIDPLIRDQYIFSYYDNLPMTKENVARVIKDLKIKYPEIVYRQAMIESGGLRSNICKNGKNLFGMKRPGSRKTYAMKKAYHKHAQYQTWLHSVADYRLWQNRKRIKTTNYYTFLKGCGYAQNPAYIKQLKGVKIPTEIRAILTENPIEFDASGCLKVETPLKTTLGIFEGIRYMLLTSGTRNEIHCPIYSPIV